MTLHTAGIWLIVLASLACILLRPYGLREAWTALAGAMLLVLAGLMPPGAALRAAAQGWNLYLFLAGMMILAELAALHGVFDWAAGRVARAARGSGVRLFVFIYGLAVLVTMFLSNDATAILLTPAVARMVRTAQAPHSLPYLLVCAFVANAASFLLPISNPANLVVFTTAMPPLPQWLATFGVPAILAIVMTLLTLWTTQRYALRQPLATAIERPTLPTTGRLVLAGLLVMAGLMLLASALGWRLGPPIFLAGLGLAALVLGPARQSPATLIRTFPWDMLLLVAGLFVMLGALDRLDLTAGLGAWLRAGGIWRSGLTLGLGSNIINNLPAGLLAGQALAGAGRMIRAAALIGVDLGPNLSITGSLATLLWLAALRRHGTPLSGWRFLRLGLTVMPSALLAALLALALAG